MSRSGRSTWDHAGPSLRGLYRDRENGWILFFVPTALTYIAATLLIRRRPLIYAGSRAEQDFWRCHRGGDHWSAS